MTLAYVEFKGITVTQYSIDLPINLANVNWLAVPAAALAAFMIAGMWYQALFSKPWTNAQGWSDARIEEIKKQMNPAKFFGGMILSYLILATVISAIVTSISEPSMVAGIVVGLVVWVAVAAITFTHQLASGRHINAWLIDAGCELVYLTIMGAIIGAWR